jgi:hypothetical protein
MDVLRSGIVKTRKDHRCHGCLALIPKGTKVYSQTSVDDDIYTLYVCDECRKWCNERKCTECMQNEEAYPGHVRECRQGEGQRCD